MCNPVYIDFSSFAPEEFKITFRSVYRSYEISDKISTYSVKIGYILAVGIGAIQATLKTYYLEPNTDSILSISIPIIGVIMGIISCISYLFKQSYGKSIHSYLIFTHYFGTLPQKDLEGAEEDTNRLRALKHYYHC